MGPFQITIIANNNNFPQKQIGVRNEFFFNEEELSENQKKNLEEEKKKLDEEKENLEVSLNFKKLNTQKCYKCS